MGDHPSHVLAALPRRRFLVSSWPWRSLAYVLTTTPIAALVAVGLSVIALPWLLAVQRVAAGRPLTATTVLLMLVGGALTATAGPLLSIPLAALERQRLGIIDRRPLPGGHRPAPSGVAAWLRTRLTEAATWREVAYAVVLGTVVPMAYGTVALLILVDLALVVSPWLAADGAGPIAVGPVEVTSPGQAVGSAVVGLVLLPLVAYLLGLLAAGQMAAVRALLGQGWGETSAVGEVARSRARLVDAYEAERRRIQRDLHDGAQHQLTSLTLQLGMARLELADDSPAAPPLARAHQQAKQLMVVLRELTQGIRPQTLTDLGLPGALRELAGQSPIPVSVTLTQQWTGRLPERVETTTYFVASEALANVTKHSAATHAEVTLSRAGNLLVMEVRDDGHGGADPAAGSGLTGLADRVGAVNGRLLLASPTGGPTVVRVELPCDQ